MRVVGILPSSVGLSRLSSNWPLQRPHVATLASELRRDASAISTRAASRSHFELCAAIAVEPRPNQLVSVDDVALSARPMRLLIADDVASVKHHGQSPLP